MTWRENLGDQIRKAREAAGFTQRQLAEKTSVKREHISNIELGKNSPAVNIITDIAKALGTRFQLDGCQIEPSSDDPPTCYFAPAPEQMKLDFGVEYRFTAQSFFLTAHSVTEVELRATLAEKRPA